MIELTEADFFLAVRFLHTKQDEGLEELAEINFNTIKSTQLFELIRYLSESTVEELRQFLEKKPYSPPRYGDRHWDPPPGRHPMDGRVNTKL